ncbi:hypothetical protein AB0A05_27405 [Streptomyces sp. NPDC046374]|uniref:hypothetical protein n=1 Tax=Streptomyces sp. NPDC046374 TaxID=3154917 RepID=UPI003409F456
MGFGGKREELAGRQIVSGQVEDEHEGLLPPEEPPFMGALAPAPNGDPIMEEILGGLATCLCTTLARAGRPACCCMWYRGSGRPPMDYCHCDCEDGEGQGVAWVRMLNMENAAMTGTNPRISGFRADCAIPAPRWRMTVELGVYRCVPTGDGENGPSCQERTNSAADGHWDDLLLMQAAQCCPAIVNRRPVFIRVDPVGPLGGCAGSVVALWVDYRPSKVNTGRPPMPKPPGMTG